MYRGFEREKSDGVVTPVIAQAAFDQLTIIDETVHRHEFDRSHSQTSEVFNHRSCGQARVRAAQVLGNIRMALGETFNVKLIKLPFHARGFSAAHPLPR